MTHRQIAKQFEGLANQIGLKVDGLQGATLYRDSQFELATRGAGLSAAELKVARAAFNRAFEERVVREFPAHSAATISRSRLEDAKAVA